MSVYAQAAQDLTSLADIIREKTGLNNGITGLELPGLVDLIDNNTANNKILQDIIEQKITSFDAGVNNIPPYCFYECTELTEVKGTCHFGKQKEGHNFYNCTKLTSYGCSGDIPDYCYYNCGDFPDEWSPANNIGYKAFAFNKGEIYKGVAYSTRYDSFDNCSQLREWHIKDHGLSSMDCFFYTPCNCEKLEKIFIQGLPYSTHHFTITDDGCKNIKEIYLMNTNDTITWDLEGTPLLDRIILDTDVPITLKEPNVFQNTAIAEGTGYIYVPENLVETYKIATNWVIYANQILPISDDIKYSEGNEV